MFDKPYFPGTIEELECSIQKRQDLQEMMKRTNAYYRKNKTLDGCPDENKLDIEKLNKHLKHSDGKPFPNKKLRFNLNSMKQEQNRLLNQTALRDAGDGWTFNGGRIVIDRKNHDILLCDSSDEINQRIHKLGVIFYSKTDDGTPRMMYFEHILRELLEMTKKYDELYPPDSK